MMQIKRSQKFMPHLEDLVLTDGIPGAQRALHLLEELNVALTNKKSACTITPKVDGAPAVFMGVDPRDGRYFIATKGLFNKEPVVYKTPQEIEDGVDNPHLKRKLLIAFREFKSYNVDHYIYHGDFLFDGTDLEFTEHKDVDYVNFHPNVINYSLKLPDTFQAISDWSRYRIGVVWHTKWKWNNDDTFSRIEFDRLNMDNPNSNVYDYVLPRFDHVVVKCSLKIDLAELYRLFSKLEMSVPDAPENFWLQLKTYWSQSRVERFEEYLDGFFNKKIEGLKTQKAIDGWNLNRAECQQYWSDNIEMIRNLGKFYHHLRVVKHKFIHVFEKYCPTEFVKTVVPKIQYIEDFMDNSKPYFGEPFRDEGFVVQFNGDEPVKFVNRTEFTRINRSDEYNRGWELKK